MQAIPRISAPLIIPVWETACKEAPVLIRGGIYLQELVHKRFGMLANGVRPDRLQAGSYINCARGSA